MGNSATAQPVSQSVSDSTKLVTRHGNMTTWKTRAFQPAASASRARTRAQPLSPPAVRTGPGSATSSPSRARARRRSTAPSPRAPASITANTGSPSNVTARPAPSENSVTAKTNPAMATGSEVRVYPNSRKVAAAKGARQAEGGDGLVGGVDVVDRADRADGADGALFVAGAVACGRVSIVMAGLLSVRSPSRGRTVRRPRLCCGRGPGGMGRGGVLGCT
ncbi:hypothetical protein GCM10010252_18580 [Streptomyces aureoverticillatus]|nr:hypothetical protein GCM10010252_18580 [Streptomyces aureoverticillatus]